MRPRVHSLVVAYSPAFTGDQADDGHMGPQHSPDILDNRCPRGDEIPPIYIILRNSLWDSKWDRTEPPKEFFKQRRDVRQVYLI